MWGGNLSVLASLAGTPYMPDIDGGILFLEDVGEQPYRIERMLNTLYLSGILGKQRAIVFGDFRMEKFEISMIRLMIFPPLPSIFRARRKSPC